MNPRHDSADAAKASPTTQPQSEADKATDVHTAARSDGDPAPRPASDDEPATGPGTSPKPHPSAPMVSDESVAGEEDPGASVDIPLQ